MRILALVGVLVLLVLAVLNPSMDAFEEYVATESEEVIRERIAREEGSGSALARALSGAGGSIAELYVGEVAQREDYLIFSVYTIDFDGQKADGDAWRFLGIAGRFYVLERPAALEDGGFR